VGAEFRRLTAKKAPGGLTVSHHFRNRSGQLMGQLRTKTGLEAPTYALPVGLPTNAPVILPKCGGRHLRRLGTRPTAVVGRRLGAAPQMVCWTAEGRWANRHRQLLPRMAVGPPGRVVTVADISRIGNLLTGGPPDRFGTCRGRRDEVDGQDHSQRAVDVPTI
jgi:hypothetical protein